jgi:hypothetical protein
MPRPCKLCVNPDQVAVRTALASGATDRAIGRQFGITHVSVGRHRREHLVKPMQAAATALDRGRAVRQQREEQLAAVERGDPLSIFKLDAIASDISRIAQRLDGSAGEAAAAGQHGGHAALAGQLLRQAELRARLGGHDRPAPIEGHGAMFSVTIQFSTGQAERISVPVATIDGGATEDDFS